MCSRLARALNSGSEHFLPFSAHDEHGSGHLLFLVCEHFLGISMVENGGGGADSLPVASCADTARTLALCPSLPWTHWTPIGRQIELYGGLEPWYTSVEEIVV